MDAKEYYKKTRMVETRNWTLQMAINFADEFYEAKTKQLTIPVVVSTLVCDIEKGTRCKDSFPDYKDGKCRICGGQAN